jgi:hypothetical protein
MRWQLQNQALVDEAVHRAKAAIQAATEAVTAKAAHEAAV